MKNNPPAGKNPFAQFADMPGTGSQPAGPNPFAQFDAPKPEQAVEDDSTWFQRSTDEYMKYMTEDLPEALTGDRETHGDPINRATSAMSAGVSAASNILVDGVGSMLGAIIPDSIQEDIKDFSRSKWEHLLQQPGAKEVLAAAEAGGEAYMELKEQYPDTVNQFEDLVTVASVVPFAQGSKVLPSGSGLTKRAKKQQLNNRKGRVQDMMEPVGKNGDGDVDWVGRGPFGSKVYNPSPRELEVNLEVTKVPSVNPSKPVTWNRARIMERASELKDQLDNYIVQRGNPQVNYTKLRGRMANRVNALADETLLGPGAMDYAIKVYKKANELIQASDGSALGLLNARRQLDSWVSKQKPRHFDADAENGLTYAIRTVRDEMNNSVNGVMKNNKVRSSLDKQSKLWQAADTLEAKALKEADGYVGIIMDKVKNTTGVGMPSTPLAIGATLATAGTVTGAAVLGGAGAAVATYGGLRALSSPQGRIWLGQLQDMAKANPALAPEVNALVQLVEGLPEPAEEYDNTREGG